MKKLASLALVLCAFCAVESKAALFEDKCNPTPKCAPECFGCAPNKPEILVTLDKCAYKDKPYNYYTWKKIAEKEVPSDRYDWAASPAM
ncbi:MAG: hypothetical protein SFT81_00480 [Candidatus Caenarcaniphilales bacterium]|nr:hypothetical protein [Candidatus Caenarcaniphilales bacterium]